MPLTVDEVREKIGRSGKVNYAPWADHREFMDNVYNGFITDMRKILEAEDPGASAGIGGGQAPAHCTGYDYWKLMKASTSIEAYDIGNSIELTRSFNTDQHSLCVMSTFARGKQAGYQIWSRMLHGDNGSFIWWSESVVDPVKMKVMPEAKTIAPYYKELTSGIVKQLRNMERDDDKIAIHYSQASIRSRYIQETVQNKDWVTAVINSSQYANMEFGRVRNGWCKIIEDLGMQYRFVSYEQLENGELLKNGYKVFIMGSSESISDKEAEAIRAFVKAGGTVIGDKWTGRMDKHCKVQAKGMIDDVFASGKGKRITLEIKDYVDKRGSKPAEAFKYRKEIESLLTEAGVKVRLSLSNTKINGMETFYFKKGDSGVYAIMRNVDVKQTGLGDIKIAEAESEKEPAKLKLPKKGNVYNVRTGEYLGETDSISAELNMWEPIMFSSLPYKVEGVKLEADKKSYASGEEVTLKASVNIPKGSTTPHVLHLELQSAKGEIPDCYSFNITADATGACHQKFKLAKDEEIGSWKIVARDVISGQSTTVDVTIK